MGNSKARIYELPGTPKLKKKPAALIQRQLEKEVTLLQEEVRLVKKAYDQARAMLAARDTRLAQMREEIDTANGKQIELLTKYTDKLEAYDKTIDQLFDTKVQAIDFWVNAMVNLLLRRVEQAVKTDAPLNDNAVNNVRGILRSFLTTTVDNDLNALRLLTAKVRERSEALVTEVPANLRLINGYGPSYEAYVSQVRQYLVVIGCLQEHIDEAEKTASMVVVDRSGKEVKI